jgi:hypothetical protein
VEVKTQAIEVKASNRLFNSFNRKFDSLRSADNVHVLPI